MATNVSSLRVAIRGDVSGFEAALIKGEKAASEFAKTLSKSATTRQGLAGSNGLDRQLSDVRRQIDAMAEAYVTGGKVARSEIDALIAKETQLQGRIAARNTLVASARGQGVDLPETTVARNNALAASSLQVAAASRHVAAGSSRASMAVTQLGFAAEDAAIVYGTTGLSGALRAAGNNLSFVAAMFNPLLGIAVGVGTALGAIVIPKLLGTAEAAERAAIAFRTLRDARFESTIAGIRSESPDIPGAFDDMQPENRFQAARKSMLRGIEQQGATLDDVRRSLNGFAAEFAPGLRQSQIDSIFESFLQGDASAITSARFRDNPDAPLRGLQLSEEGLAAARELGEQAVEANARIQQLTKGLMELGGEEAKRNQLDSFNALVAPLADAGANLFSAAWQDIANAAKQRDQFKAIAKEQERDRRKPSQGLAGGFEFGSREAVSTLNRAMFRSIGEKKEEKEIAKNTHGTEVAVRDVVRAVRDLGSQFVPALAGEPL